MNKKNLTLVTLFVLSTAFASLAVEGGAAQYVPGSFSDFSGMPPSKPGFYFANYFLNYGNAEANASKQLPFNILLASGVTANVQSEAPAASYAYPFQLGDVTLSSGIVVPYVWQDIQVSATFSRNGNQLSGYRQQDISGLGDIELLPVMGVWTNGDFSIGGAMNIYAPTGAYDTGNLANPGMGYWTFDPLVSFSWLSSTIGTEFTVFTGVDFNTENTTTSYTSGDTVHMDATLAQHFPLFGGFGGVGASGFYMQQFTGDSGSGARLGSFELESAGVGPTLSYIHNIGKSTLVVDGSWMPQVQAVNTLKGNYFWLRIAIAF